MLVTTVVWVGVSPLPFILHVWDILSLLSHTHIHVYPTGLYTTEVVHTYVHTYIPTYVHTVHVHVYADMCIHTVHILVKGTSGWCDSEGASYMYMCICTELYMLTKCWPAGEVKAHVCVWRSVMDLLRSVGVLVLELVWLGCTWSSDQREGKGEWSIGESRPNLIHVGLPHFPSTYMHMHRVNEE